MEEAIPRTETWVLVPGKVRIKGYETDQPTDVNYKASQFIKHQVLWSDPYHSPNFRKGTSFCVHITGKVAEPSCDLLKLIALGA